MAPEGGPIASSNVLAAEGRDEQNFFEKLLRHLKIADVQIRCVGGKRNFGTDLRALVNTPGFFEPGGSSRVRHLGIVRDRDGDDAFKSVAAIVSDVGLVPPSRHGEYSDGAPKVGIFIMPGDTIDGTMLEDLCLKTVEEDHAIECVQMFASCVAALANPPKNMSKAKVQAFKSHVFLVRRREPSTRWDWERRRDIGISTHHVSTS